MKYLKYFESIEIDDFDTEKIGKKIYQYVHEFGKNDYYVKLIPGSLGLTDDFLRYSEAQFIKAVEDFVDIQTGRTIKDFISKYENMVNKGHLNINLEEVEDLFLDIQNYTIEKTDKFDNQEVFNILITISKVSDDELQYLNNHIYGTVKKRLPNTLYIKRVTVLCEADGTYGIKIRLFENKQTKSTDGNLADQIRQRLINPNSFEVDEDDEDED